MAKEYSIDNMIGENVFAIIGYVQRALRHSGFSKRVIDEYHKKVTSGDYTDACAVSQEYIDMVNDKLKEADDNEGTDKDKE